MTKLIRIQSQFQQKQSQTEGAHAEIIRVALSFGGSPLI